MKGHVRRRDRPALQRSDLLTPAEIDVLLRSTNYARDRAFISTLWEAGPRPVASCRLPVVSALLATGNWQLATHVANG